MENPGSTTYTIPSIVREVSAMFVLTITLRPGKPPALLGCGAVLNISIRTEIYADMLLYVVANQCKWCKNPVTNKAYLVVA